jgi:mannuronan 5-epimerase
MPVLAGPPDQESTDLVAKLDALNALLMAEGSAFQANGELIAAAGLSGIVRPDAFVTATVPAARMTSADPVELSRVNMRLALTPLSQAFGAEDNSIVLSAQTSPDGSALVIARGDATLADLAAQLDQETSAGPVRLSGPLVIMNGASLTLNPGDVLELSRPGGAFIVNFGHLAVTGATIAGVGEASNAARPFSPFITTAAAGTIDVRASRFLDLGFGDTLKFSGFSVMRSVLESPDQPSRIESSSFERMVSLSVSGDTGIMLRDNRFSDMRGPTLVVARTQDARIMSNLFFGAMRTNAIRLEGGSAGGLIAGNIVLGGDRAGIVVRSDSVGATVADNIVWNRDGGGIVLFGADCGRVHDNLVIANQQKGIEVRFSLSAQIYDNTVYSNESAGIWISDQPATAQTTLTGNVVSFNGAGLAGANTGVILMDGNNFSRQYQQFLSGDIAAQTPEVARHMTGDTPFVLASGGVSDLMPEATVCTDQ